MLFPVLDCAVRVLLLDVLSAEAEATFEKPHFDPLARQFDLVARGVRKIHKLPVAVRYAPHARKIQNLVARTLAHAPQH